MLSGCGAGFFQAVNNTGTVGTATHLYVVNNSSTATGGTLTGYSLTSGVLAQVSGSPITLPATPTSIVVAPNNAFLYVGTQLGIFVYTINSDGSLTEGNTDNIVYLGPTYPYALAVDPTSSWLIVANHTSSELDALPIDPTTGNPASVTPVSVTLTNPSPTHLSISPANNNILVSMGTGGVNAIGFAPTSSTPMGRPVLMPLLKGSTTANAVAFDTSSTYAFIAESTGSSTDVLRVVAISNLSADVQDYPTGKGPSAILPDISGAYLYVANNTDNTISGFSYASGALTALTDSPFPTSKAPLGLAEDSTKSYVMSVGSGTNPDLYVYSFDATSLGTLDIGATATTGSSDPSLAIAIAATH